VISTLLLLTVGFEPAVTETLPPPPPPAEPPGIHQLDELDELDEATEVDGPTVTTTPPDGEDGTVMVAEPPPAEPGSATAPAARTPRPVPSEEALARQSEAKIDDKDGKDRFGRTGSPQRFALEIKLGPYLPQVDRLHDGPGMGPYGTIFGRTNDMGVATRAPRKGIMPVLGFEWQFWYAGGPIGLGTQIGFFRDKANAILANPEPDENIRSGADTVTFMVIPVSMLLVYRFELLADRWKIPLVPYAKGGAAYGFWQTRNSNGLSEDSRGNKGRGGVWGWQANAGLMLRLDFLEPGTAKKLDNLTGINHTYIFGEYQLMRLANFGHPNAIAVGDGTWFAGFAIEF
jgi:hypothetical protein